MGIVVRDGVTSTSFQITTLGQQNRQLSTPLFTTPSPGN